MAILILSRKHFNTAASVANVAAGLAGGAGQAVAPAVTIGGGVTDPFPATFTATF